METTEKIAHIEQAKTELLERGWCQNHLLDGEGRVCLVGSFMKALDAKSTTWIDHYGQIVPLINSVAEATDLGSWSGLVDWNNDPIRTADDVIQALDETIIYLKENRD